MINQFAHGIERGFSDRFFILLSQLLLHNFNLLQLFHEGRWVAVAGDGEQNIER